MSARTGIRVSLAVAAAVFFGYPLVWMALTSLKTPAEVEASAWGLPKSVYVGNYRLVFAAKQGTFARYYLNSAVVCGGSVVVACLAAAAAAYAFARLRFRGKECLFLLLLGGMMIPVHVTLVPLYRLMVWLGIRNTVFALIGPYVAFALPVSVFILRAFFEALPRDMEDAARLDGCSAAGAFWTVALPLSAPALSTVFILNFVTMWNEFAFALTLTGGRSTTLPVGIWQVSGNFGANIPAVTAGLTLGVLPALAVYFFAQRHIVRGMTAGALERMRIIGGHCRGLRLATPKGHEVRPILDRVRESLFGVLRAEVAGARVADLFAGTGVIGLEALSRGAEFCIFVERDPRCIATVNENIRRARQEDLSRVVRADVFRCPGLLSEDGPFDLVFVDPPYRLLRSPRNSARVEKLLARLGENDILSDEGTIILRFPADARIPGHVGRLTQVDRRRYGAMKIALFAAPQGS